MPTRRRRRARPTVRHAAAAWLTEAERLYRDFERLTPYPKPRPFVKSFDSFAEYERWRRAQTNPWLR